MGISNKLAKYSSLAYDGCLSAAYYYSRGKAMPNFRKLEPSEVQEIENKGKGLRKLIEEQYDAILAEYSIGDYGEATLEIDENRLTVRNRMKAAARRRNLAIDFRRTKEDILRFQVVAPPEPAPPLPPAAKKPGRKKQAG
jgi:hypothetical protein